jgi:hypothetical protein
LHADGKTQSKAYRKERIKKQLRNFITSHNRQKRCFHLQPDDIKKRKC